MELPDTEVEKLCYLVRWTLRRFKSHPQWDDILAEAYSGMWRAVQEVQLSGRCKLTTAATRGALWSALDFLRSDRNEHRTLARRHSRYVQVLRPLSLDEICVSDELAAENVVARRPEPSVPDFSPDLLERILWRGRLDRLEAALPALEWQVFQLNVLGGDLLGEVAKTLGISYQRAGEARRHALRVARSLEELK